MVLIKIVHITADDVATHYVNLDDQHMTFAHLQAAVRDLFRVGPQFSLSYCDDEGDDIKVETDVELKESVHFVTPSEPRPYLLMHLSDSGTSTSTPTTTTTSTPIHFAPASTSQSPDEQLHTTQTPTNKATDFPLAELFGPGGLATQFLHQHIPVTTTTTTTSTTSSPSNFSPPSSGDPLRDIAQSWLAKPEIRNLASSFGIQLPSESWEIDSLLTAFLPPCQTTSNGSDQHPSGRSNDIERNGPEKSNTDSEDWSKLEQMLAMGFLSEAANRVALQQAQGNLEHAISLLV
eukprot:TRINITY_DN11697_c0_g1_i1.p1 TRINITY_DN11697_c0_g1~~TRINITY_DN11697_c0_g1_i1.p1  ORF type:complete len:291 (+),score=53.50 TRINITY_DN11697_c0_g1_i1:232-1104(+)